jgi:hypothetical protein
MFASSLTWQSLPGETAMHARLNVIEVIPDRVRDIVAEFDAIRARLAVVPGLLVAYNLLNDDGIGLTFTLYESAEAAAAALPAVKSLRSGNVEKLASPHVREFANARTLVG